MRVVAVLLLVSCLSVGADLSAVKAEADPEKRSDRALDLAVSTLADARQAYNAGDYKRAISSLATIGECVDISVSSLKASGKNPRKSKYYKRAELKLRELGRRLDEFARETAVDDRPAVEETLHKTNQLHDELLVSIMEKK